MLRKVPGKDRDLSITPFRLVEIWKTSWARRYTADLEGPVGIWERGGFAEENSVWRGSKAREGQR